MKPMRRNNCPSCTAVAILTILLLGSVFAYIGLANYAEYSKTTPFADSIHRG